MMRSRIASLALAVIGAVVLSTPAFAAVTSFTATLTTFTGSGAGLPASPTPLPATGCPGLVCTTASGHLVSYTSTAFSLGSGVFVVNQFNPSATNAGGTVPLPTSSNQIYVIGSIVNQNSLAGSASAGGGPGGGFGGAIGSGSLINVLLGITPFGPGNVFGNLVLPVNAGSSATVTTMASILGNAVTVTVSGKAWTTGAITFMDTNLGTTTGGATMAVVANPFVTSGSAAGTNSLTANGGQITLVAPITIKIPKTGADLRAGYSVLTITFIPEPSTLVLLGAGVAGLVAIGRRRNA